MDLREIGWEGVECMHLPHDIDWWRAVVNTVINFWFYKWRRIIMSCVSLVHRCHITECLQFKDVLLGSIRVKKKKEVQ
jgi:hypothetical protein